jgi:hypothetical protein
MADGKPLPGGTVSFYPVGGKGNPSVAQIGEDGSYDMPDAPLGEIQISVNNANLKAGAAQPPVGMSKTPAGRDNPGGGAPKDALKDKKMPEWQPPPKAPGKYVPIDKKFNSPETSGLTLKVTGGDQDHNIQLSESPPQGRQQ